MKLPNWQTEHPKLPTTLVSARASLFSDPVTQELYQLQYVLLEQIFIHYGEDLNDLLCDTYDEHDIEQLILRIEQRLDGRFEEYQLSADPVERHEELELHLGLLLEHLLDNDGDVRFFLAEGYHPFPYMLLSHSESFLAMTAEQQSNQLSSMMYKFPERHRIEFSLQEIIHKWLDNKLISISGDLPSVELLWPQFAQDVSEELGPEFIANNLDAIQHFFEDAHADILHEIEAGE